MIFQLFGPIVPSCTGTPLLPGGAEKMCTLCDLLALMDNLIKFAAVLSPILVTIFAVWGAFLIITSAGSKDKITKGRAIILNAVIGLLIVVGAWVVVSTTFLVLTGSYQGPLPMPWYRIKC